MAILVEHCCFLLMRELMHMCACICVCISHVCRYPWKVKEGIRSLGTGMTGSCEPLHEGAKNQSHFSGSCYFLLLFLKLYLLSWYVYVYVACVCDVAYVWWMTGTKLRLSSIFYLQILLFWDPKII